MDWSSYFGKSGFEKSGELGNEANSAEEFKDFHVEEGCRFFK